MGVYSGKVVNGVIQVKGVLLPEGARVTILVPFEDEDDFWLTPAMEAELDEAIAQADRGEGIPAEQVLARLQRPRGGPTSK
jgi:hypothetical protein